MSIPFVKALSLLLAVVLPIPLQAKTGVEKVFAKDNLVAWCIVPFDAKKRGPAERAEMAKRLGFTKIAYDWRGEHVPTFEQEILEYKKRDIEFFAFLELGTTHSNRSSKTWNKTADLENSRFAQGEDSGSEGGCGR